MRLRPPNCRASSRGERRCSVLVLGLSTSLTLDVFHANFKFEAARGLRATRMHLPPGDGPRAASDRFPELISLTERVVAYRLDRKLEYLMGSLSELKAQLGDVPGLDTLEVTFGDGRQHITLNGQTVTVGVNASTDDIRAALNLQKIDAITTTVETPTATATVTTTPSKTTMSVTGASHAGMSLKQMLTDRKAKIAAAHEKLANNFGKLDQATAALDSLGEKVGSEADDLMQLVGQFTNDLGGES